MIPKVSESTFNVPDDSGVYFLFASSRAMARGPPIGKNLPRIIPIPPVTFQKMLLSASPSKPLPLLALVEVYWYSISENPWYPGLFSHVDGLTAQSAFP